MIKVGIHSFFFLTIDITVAASLLNLLLSIFPKISVLLLRPSLTMTVRDKGND